jgi:NAD(P)-dependent dehydrogenase (short-subunit alcohol dehydrogenase family)
MIGNQAPSSRFTCDEIQRRVTELGEWFQNMDLCGVRTVAPGPVWTPLIASTMEPEKVENFGQQDSLKRPAQPAELAHAFVYLPSEESSYVTGAIFDLTGGRMLP